MSPQTRSFILVALQTLFGAAAQVVLKRGTATIPKNEGVWRIAIHIVTNPMIFAGFCLYGIAAVLMVLALRRGQLSLLYPVIALTFVWVAILSVLMFNEVMTPLRIAGIAAIIGGVGVLGMSK